MGGSVQGVRLATHAGTGQGNAVAVAAPGVGRQVCREGMQAMHAAVAADDPVVVTRADPVVAGGGPVQIDRGHRAGGRTSTSSLKTARAHVICSQQGHTAVAHGPGSLQRTCGQQLRTGEPRLWLSVINKGSIPKKTGDPPGGLKTAKRIRLSHPKGRV